MDPFQAFEILSRVCAQTKGDLAEHQTMQQALAAIRQALTPAPQSDPPAPSDDITVVDPMPVPA